MYIKKNLAITHPLYDIWIKTGTTELVHGRKTFFCNKKFLRRIYQPEAIWEKKYKHVLTTSTQNIIK